MGTTLIAERLDEWVDLPLRRCSEERRESWKLFEVGMLAALGINRQREEMKRGLPE
jgi:hypothetical protein